MLRPTRRPARSLAGTLVLIFSLALIWPAGSVAAAPTPTIGGRPDPAARGEREPAVGSQGVRPMESDTAGGPDRQLQRLGVDRANRGPADRAGRAPSDTTGVAAPPAVLAVDSGAPAADSFGGWFGIDQTTSGFEPPDPWVAVGPDDVVQTVNTRLRFSNREGATRADVDAFAFFDLANFESCLPPALPGCTPIEIEIDGVADPRWHYDSVHNRWVGMILSWHCDRNGALAGDDSLGFLNMAISLTGDPTGDYYQLFVQYDYLPDYPMLGISADKLTLSANEFLLNDTADCTSGEPFDAASTTTFDWNELLTFPAAPNFSYHFDFDHFSLRPAVAPQATSNTIFVVGEQLLPVDDPNAATTSNVVYYRLTGTNATGGVVQSPPQDLTSLGIIPPFVDPPAPLQPGGALPATIVDRRPTDAIWRDNVLTFVSTYPCDPSGGPTETRDCARVTQLNTAPAVPSRRQDVLIASSGRDVWYAGIGQSQSGILHVVYTQSSATEGMSAFDRYQLPSDPIYRLSAARRIVDGGAIAYNGDRWGDYVGVAQDPRDTNAVWQGNQYTKSGGIWGTRISQLQTAGTTYVAVPPVRLLDSRVGNGTTGAFAHGVPKSIDIAGRGGIPNDAVAITANLTIAGQTAAGYASLTQTPIANPSTSTLNFPLGDTRANNVTTPLSSIGGVSITYRGSPGRTAHFILDVTGYFLANDTGATYNALAGNPVRVLDSRFGTGLSGKFLPNQPRTFQVTGAAVPTGAVAITGNVTVVNQTRAGFVSLTPTPQANPTTSTINFPTGDVRANGVTVQLSPTGQLSAVYKASGGSTDLILDVTGYYLENLNGARFVPLTPGRRMDTRFAAPQEGLSGPFSANIARTLVIEPYQGVPANATAITGNLTVVGQQRAGYVSMTTTANNNPTTSTINFPLGDTRANGVTGPLSGPGSVALVYKASGGLTHLILDLTGYFR
ncbi:MAG TPA: hypothetical protein VFO50_00430 [Candidatus Limnocylindrales bacterium]|nr:hypothetical protein [Candidatus Limnocylindrales bacterium]